MKVRRDKPCVMDYLNLSLLKVAQESVAKCAYSIKFSTPSDSSHASISQSGAIEERIIVPSSFSLRVGTSCVLVTVLPKDPLKILGIESSPYSLGIVKTPELFCSLIGTFVN